MLEVFIGALGALALRDIIYEVVERFNHWQWNKRNETFWDYMEDLEADDD